MSDHHPTDPATRFIVEGDRLRDRVAELETELERRPPAVDFVAAAKSFVDAWGSGDMAGDLGARLTCSEADALAGMLRALGHHERASTWINAHAEDDDCGDAHCRCGECGREDEAT